MKTKELMIGNLAIDTCSGEIIEVVGITKNSITFSDNFTGRGRAEPILLTKEWLMICGLIPKLTHTAFQIGPLQFEIPTMIGGYHDNEKGLDMDTAITIKYVHDLQNLYFELTREKLIPKWTT